jgi:transposase
MLADTRVGVLPCTYGLGSCPQAGHLGFTADEAWSRLSAQDLKKIQRGLKRGPETLGYETGLWAAWRVAHLIEEECGVRYHASQAWRILRQLGWSCQRPVGRSSERKEMKIQLWKKKRWPETKKKPGEKGVRSPSSTKAN